MRLCLIVVLAGMVGLCACSKKSNTPESTSEMLPSGNTQQKGEFVSNVHTTKGKVSISVDSTGQKKLVFENFQTDNGPDLRVWLSPSTSGSPHVEAGVLKAVSGNFSYTLSSAVNTTTHNKVLIWCEDFSVLFGHAVLQ